MISSGATSSCFQTMPQQHHQSLQIFSMPHHEEDQAPSSFSLEPSNNSSSSGPENHSASLLYSLSVLKEKFRQAKSLVGILIAPPEEPHPPPPPPPPHHHQSQPSESTAIAVASMNNVIQDIIVTASSMMFTCQQMSTGTSTPPGNNKAADDHDYARLSQQDYISIRSNNSTTGGPFGPTHDQTLDWFNESYNDCPTRDATTSTSTKISGNNYRQLQPKKSPISTTKNYDIVELDVADLLAKYTHYCQVCGKGFKRDANLRMHMRAHGDEYKTSDALSNPMKKTNNNTNDGSADGMHTECSTKLPKKYSCPQQGCRWNQKHAKFQPLKSMICVKNHYKRSHCPKMYVCKRCNRKQFSVLSDLRTHEKHCGDLRWQCSCGTTFSRKDKLMGHVALFTGHAPVAIGSLSTRVGKVDHQSHGYIPNANRN